MTMERCAVAPTKSSCAMSLGNWGFQNICHVKLMYRVGNANPDSETDWFQSGLWARTETAVGGRR